MITAITAITAEQQNSRGQGLAKQAGAVYVDYQNQGLAQKLYQ
jgi:hypothetical protein